MAGVSYGSKLWCETRAQLSRVWFQPSRWHQQAMLSVSDCLRRRAEEVMDWNPHTSSPSLLRQHPADKLSLTRLMLPPQQRLGLGKHWVDNAPSVGILRCSKNQVDARECFFQQRAKSRNLAGACGEASLSFLIYLHESSKSGPNTYRIINLNFDSEARENAN